jgi:hypothetical protein
MVEEGGRGFGRVLEVGHLPLSTTHTHTRLARGLRITPWLWPLIESAITNRGVDLSFCVVCCVFTRLHGTGKKTPFRRISTTNCRKLIILIRVQFPKARFAMKNLVFVSFVNSG